MKEPITIALVSGIAVAAVAVVVAIGIGVGGAARPANVSQRGASETEAKPVSAPPGSMEYAASWRLDSSTGNVLSISVTGPGSGCTTLGYVQVAETSTTVTVTPRVIFDQKRGEGCPATLSVEPEKVTLVAPLGNHILIHGATTTPRAAG